MKRQQPCENLAKSILGRGTSMCQSPEKKMDLVRSSTRKEASVPGSQWEVVAPEACGQP